MTSQEIRLWITIFLIQYLMIGVGALCILKVVIELI